MPITLAPDNNTPTTPDEAIIAYLRKHQSTPGLCSWLPMALTIMLEHDQFSKSDLRETLADMITTGEVVHAPYETEEGQSTYLLYAGRPMPVQATAAQPMPPMTSQEYIDDGAQRCPYCRSGAISTCSATQHDTHIAWVDVKCHDCDAEWQDTYELTGYASTNK